MLVSIMMPAHNAAKYLEEAILSVLNQSYQDFELCIVDDGSTDNTRYMALSFRDPRIKVKSIPHSGCPVARNHCLEMMTGDVYARLDADDTHHPERIEQQLALLEDYDIVTTGYNWQRGKMLQPRKTGPVDLDLYMRGGGGGPVCASIVCRKEVYDNVGGFDPDLRAGSDGEWNFRAVLAGYTWGYIPEPLYNQRRHPTQISKQLRVEQRKTHAMAVEKWGSKWLAQ